MSEGSTRTEDDVDESGRSRRHTGGAQLPRLEVAGELVERAEREHDPVTQGALDRHGEAHAFRAVSAYRPLFGMQ